MIKMNNSIPLIIKEDLADPQRLEDLLTAMKLYCEEVTQKAQEMQMAIRADAPGVNDLNEGEFVRAVVGGLHYIYTMENGVIFRWAIT